MFICPIFSYLFSLILVRKKADNHVFYTGLRNLSIHIDVECNCSLKVIIKLALASYYSTPGFQICNTVTSTQNTFTYINFYLSIISVKYFYLYLSKMSLK